MNLIEQYVRAALTKHYLADFFGRNGFKTESRRLRIQADITIRLIEKAADEIPKLEAPDVAESVRAGKLTPGFITARRARGKHLARVGEAEKIMLKTLRQAFDNFYKIVHADDWTRRQQINAVSRMMKGVIEEPKKRAVALLVATSLRRLGRG